MSHSLRGVRNLTVVVAVTRSVNRRRAGSGSGPIIVVSVLRQLVDISLDLVSI